MKKVMDAVDTLVDQALRGMVIAYPEYLTRVGGTFVLARATPKDRAEAKS